MIHSLKFNILSIEESMSLIERLKGHNRNSETTYLNFYKWKEVTKHLRKQLECTRGEVPKVNSASVLKKNSGVWDLNLTRSRYVNWLLCNRFFISVCDKIKCPFNVSRSG